MVCDLGLDVDTLDHEAFGTHQEHLLSRRSFGREVLGR